MKTTALLLLLLPFGAFAQVSTITCLHFDTAAINGPLVINDNTDQEAILRNVKDNINYRGNVEFKIGFANLKCDDAVSNQLHNSLVATHVRISCMFYPILTGDRLEYNTATHLATLSGHVTVIDNGTSKLLGNTATIDFSNDRYKLLHIK
jgi:lipopolysaccharide assembly outer membrane protein LptD (OstA)